MNVWLVTVGEPLPTDAGSPRLLRAGILAEMLAGQGHGVHWWTSSFDHQLKTQRADGYRRVDPAPGLALHLLPGRTYQRNVSLARVGNHRDNARAFAEHADAVTPRPDVVLCSYPTPELCEAAVRYGRRHGIPVVVDVRDLWPDVFEELVPPALRPLARLALLPMARQARRVFQGAASITGITDEFVAWGARHAGRKPGRDERAFPMAYVDTPPPAQALDEARRRWHELGIRETDLNLVFFGSLGRQFDLSSVLAAARRLQGGRQRFIICGTGDRLDAYRREAEGCANVVFPGWVNSAMIRALMGMAAVGLAPYQQSDNFDSNIPNKIVEYMAGGLPIVTTLGGVCGGLLAQHECGLTYRHDDVDGLLAALAAITGDPARQAAMAQRARALYRERFDASIVYQQMIDHLQALARAARPAPGQPVAVGGASAGGATA